MDFNKNEISGKQISKSNSENKYQLAFKRMQRIKKFYKHVFIFVLVNAFLICHRYFENDNPENSFWQWETFSVSVFWTFGLLVHGLSVFGKNIFFGDGWEERKIQELIEKDNVEKWE